MSKALFESDFKQVSSQEWMDKIVKDLKGVSYEKLNWVIDHDTVLEPFYTAERNKDLDTPIHQEIISQIKEPSWKIVQNLSSAPKEEIEKALSSNVDLIFLDASSSLVNKSSIASYIKDEPSLKSISSKYSLIKLVTNPLKDWITEDKLELDLSLVENKALEIEVSGLPFHNAGADDFYELALLLSSLNEYLHHLKNTNENGLKSRKIRVELGIGINFYLGIAKIRAFRILLSQLLKAYDNPSLSVHLQATTSSYYNSHKDQYTNLLRHTTMGLAASIGNVDSLCVTPFESESPLAFRMSRNIQHILKEESYMDKVKDMMAGSYFIEELTQTFIDKVWREFCKIEDSGGFIANMKNGSIKKKIHQQHSERLQRIKDENLSMIGVNKYENPEEAPTEKLKKQKGSSNAWNLPSITLSKEI
jgi:methylmalonyl-CoA mutase